MKTYERLESEAAELLVECGRLRRENARLRKKLERCRNSVLAAAFELDDTRTEIMERKGSLR